VASLQRETAGENQWKSLTASIDEHARESSLEKGRGEYDLNHRPLDLYAPMLGLGRGGRRQDLRTGDTSGPRWLYRTRAEGAFLRTLSPCRFWTAPPTVSELCQNYWPLTVSTDNYAG
jgi:hypothetical protein